MYNRESWDAKKDFLDNYHPLMEKVRKGDRTAYNKVKELRVKEFRNTVEIVNKGHYTTENGKEFFFPADDAMICDTVFYESEICLPRIPQNDEPTIVEVQNIDCLHVGVELKEGGFNPAVLNMASRRNPGGGVVTGAGAQEETLFRRTNLFRSLYQFAPYAAQYGIKPSRHQYPLDRNFGGVYTPDAIYFRESEQNGYELMDAPVTLSFITVAGMNRPDLTPSGMIAHHHVEPIKNKIRTIYRIGLTHGHDALVLGALGCGAFCNPPRHVARLFHEVIEEPEFKNRYKKIVFAILDDHNAHQSHNPEGNFKPFKEEFAGMSQPQLTAEENSIPEEIEVATKKSWKNMPMPDKKTVIPMDATIPSAAMRIVKYGHIPQAMEDHWFMYCDETTIRYFRSWTGICIYEAKYEDDGTTCRITELTVNRDPDQYGSKDDRKDTLNFLALLTREYGGDATSLWDKIYGLG